MTCPDCEFFGHRMDLHAHLLAQHPEKVQIHVDEASGKLVYEVKCVLCDEVIRKQLRKRPEVLEEYQREIRMVAFDLLLYHMQALHEPESS